MSPTMLDDHPVERVVGRIMDLLGPMIAARYPARVWEAPEGLQGNPEVEFISEELLLANSTEVSVEEHD
jgi:hypothetical protein